MNKISAHQFFLFNVYFTFWDLVTFTYLIPTYLPSVKIIWPDIYTVSLFAQPASFHTELKDIQSKVIYPKYSKHLPYSVAHTIDCVCSKMLNHGLNHGFFFHFPILYPATYI